jgi:hypothetical protein
MWCSTPIDTPPPTMIVIRVNVRCCAATRLSARLTAVDGGQSLVRQPSFLSVRLWAPHGIVPQYGEWNAAQDSGPRTLDLATL